MCPYTTAPGPGAVSLEVVRMNSPVPGLPDVCVAVLHARFLRLLPKIETHARICFRGVRCPVTREDRVAECVALAWQWFLRLRVCPRRWPCGTRTYDARIPVRFRKRWRSASRPSRLLP